MYSNVPVAQRAADDDARYGWGKRPYSWEFAVAGQRELTRGISVSGGYFRRWFGNFLVTDDLSHTAADYDRYSITRSLIPPAPASAGGATLPGGIYTSDFFNQKAGTVAGSNNFIGRGETFFPGSNQIDHWNGFDVSVNARLAHGLIFQGGISSGKQTTDNCDIVDPANAGKFGDRSPLVELLAAPPAAGSFPSSLSSCHVEQSMQTQLKVLGSYTVPKIDVQIGATYQSIPGIEWGANYTEINSDIARPTVRRRARPSAVRPVFGDRDDDAVDPAAGGVLRRSVESAGFPRRESPSHGAHQGGRQPGHVQPVQREHADECEQHLLVGLVARRPERRGAPIDEGVGDV